MNRIKKGDTVQVRVGKDRGKTGKVLAFFMHDEKVLVEGLNLVKKHTRPKREGEKGQIVIIARPIQLSKVNPYCSACRQGVRIGFRVDETNKSKVRYCKKCQSTL